MLSSENSRFFNILQDFEKTHVLVIGDIMLDRFVYGSANRISPESPVPVLSISRQTQMLGGAGNAVANLNGLGVKSTILSIVGQDDEGAEIAALVSQMKSCDNAIVSVQNRPTTVKTRFLSGHQQLLRTDFEENTPVSSDIADQILQDIDQHIEKADVVILSDYGKGLLSEDVLKIVLEKANKAKVPVIVDPKGRDFSKYKGAFAITPNKAELSNAAQGVAVSSDAEVEKAARSIMDACGIENIVATRSSDGISVVSQKDVTHISTIPVEVFDVSGAGDTVIATIAAAVGAGANLVEAAELANIAGSIVVEKVGTAVIRRDEIAARLGQSSQTALSLDEALETVARWRAKGYKVGFTNGCFDILHQGHVTYLQEARSKCDRLLLGLNNDSSVRILKGADRPVHDEQGRATVLNGLSCIDGVVLFGAEKEGDDNTANAVIEALKPDIYFKGGDYAVDDIPETPAVRAYGGEVLVLSEVKGQSTTNSIAKIRKVS